MELEFIAGGQSPWSWANQRAGEQAISLCPTPVQPPGARDTSRFEVSRTEVEPNYSMKLNHMSKSSGQNTKDQSHQHRDPLLNHPAHPHHPVLNYPTVNKNIPQPSPGQCLVPKEIWQ